MKLLWVCLLPAALLAQAVSGPPLVERLSQDLLALASLPGTPQRSAGTNPLELTAGGRAKLKALVKDQAPALNRIMPRFAAHTREAYGKSVVPWSLAYVLTSALAGQRLPESLLESLVASILTSFDLAVVCRGTQTPLRESARYRAALETAHDALLGLGASPSHARIVVENLIYAGELILYPEGPLSRPLHIGDATL